MNLCSALAGNTQRVRAQSQNGAKVREHTGRPMSGITNDMDLWGPYVTERGWGTALNAVTDATYEEARSSGKYLDGIFGFCNSGGTVKASFALWNGQDAHLKERLFDDREAYLHGLAEPHYRYCSCRYLYPRSAFAYGTENSGSRQSQQVQRDQAFEMQFELAKETPTRIYYRLTVTNCDRSGEGPPAPLTVAAQLWTCHASCGWLEQQQEVNCVRVKATNTCCGLASRCSVLSLDCPGDPAQAPPRPQWDSDGAIVYRLHYQRESLLTVAFTESGAPGAFNRLIVHADQSGLRPEPSGCRCAIVYQLSLQPGASASLCFCLAEDEVGGSTGPDWSMVPELMQRNAQLTVDLLAAASPPRLPEPVRRVAQRAFSSILWNRQLCSADAPQSGADTTLPCLIVVPDKWHQPGMSTWEHGLHALVLCRLSPELAVAELRNQLARVTVIGEFANAQPAPPSWPLALLDLLELHIEKECAERIFIDLLHHMNWWLLKRKDRNGRNTIEGGVLGLERKGWSTCEHIRDSNDSVVWSGFFCAKMLHIAAVLQHQELKPLLDMFNVALSCLRNDAPFVGGLFRPKFAAAVESTDAAAPGCCHCAFGLVPLLGCACIPWSLVEDKESRILLDWLNWISSEAPATETPALFVRTDTKTGRFLISWISEPDFIRSCAAMFHPDAFLSHRGIRCASRCGCVAARNGSCDGHCLPGQDDLVSVPFNYLIIEALKCWESVWQQMQLEFPTGSGMLASLNEIIVNLSERLVSNFIGADDNARLFYELYRADTGEGVGAGHASWSSLIANVCQNLDRQPTLALLQTAPSMPLVVGRIMPKSSVVHVFRQVLRSSIKMEDFAPDSSFDWNSDD